MQPHRHVHATRSSQVSSHRSRVARAASVALALSLVFSACGGGDEEGADEPAEEDAGGEAAGTASGDEGGGEGEQDAGFGGDGHWTAAQLCSLADLAMMGALFPGVEVVESTGIDDPDWSHCSWKDAGIDQYDPASKLFGVSNTDHAGQQFSDSFEPLDIPGTDQAVFAEDLGDPLTSSVLVAVGDQQLTVDFAKSASGAREVAEVIATTWATLQAP